jgi:hypothetical protein
MQFTRCCGGSPIPQERPPQSSLRSGAMHRDPLEASEPHVERRGFRHALDLHPHRRRSVVVAGNPRPNHGEVRYARTRMERRPSRHRPRVAPRRHHSVHRWRARGLRRHRGRNPRDRNRTSWNRTPIDLPAGQANRANRRHRYRRRSDRISRRASHPTREGDSRGSRRPLLRALPAPWSTRTRWLCRSPECPAPTIGNPQADHQAGGSSDRGCACTNVARSRSTDTWVYRCVVSNDACPSNSWTARRSAPPSRTWVAAVCRSP